MQTPLNKGKVMILNFETELEFLEFQNNETNQATIEITSLRTDYRNSYYVTAIVVVKENIRYPNPIFTNRVNQLKKEEEIKNQKITPEDLPF